MSHTVFTATSAITATQELELDVDVLVVAVVAAAVLCSHIKLYYRQSLLADALHDLLVR